MLDSSPHGHRAPSIRRSLGLSLAQGLSVLPEYDVRRPKERAPRWRTGAAGVNRPGKAQPSRPAAAWGEAWIGGKSHVSSPFLSFSSSGSARATNHRNTHPLDLPCLVLTLTTRFRCP